MMPAAKHGDPQLGVDIHLCIVPPGTPVPLPTPHISVVFDPFDYILKREHQAHLPVGRFCEYIGRPIPQDLYTNAQTQAMYARNLVLSVGLPQ